MVPKTEGTNERVMPPAAQGERCRRPGREYQPRCAVYIVMGKSDPNMPIVELKKRMSGVTKNMNIVLPFTEDQVAGGLTIGDLDNPKKYTMEVHVVIKRQLTEQLSELEKVRRDPNAQYRVKRDEGEIFYWVPIECLLR